jgi:hypothetical protein
VLANAQTAGSLLVEKSGGNHLTAVAKERHKEKA